MLNLSQDAIVFFVIFACYLLAIQVAVVSYARYASHRTLMRNRLQVRSGLHAPAVMARKASGASPRFAGKLARAGLNVRSQFVPLCAAGGGLAVLLPLLALDLPVLIAGPLALLSAVAAPPIGLAIMRTGYLRRIEAQLPDAIDMLVRSLKAGHPVSTSLRLVRTLPAPIGEVFATVSDEVTYGLDLETAMKNMQARVDQPDVGLLVAAIGLQIKTGGNLAELLERLSHVIRDRLRMRLKVRALSAEGRFSAVALSVLPIVLFVLLQFIAPTFYAGVWGDRLFVPALMLALLWLTIGNVIMFRMVRFDI